MLPKDKKNTFLIMKLSAIALISVILGILFILSSHQEYLQSHPTRNEIVAPGPSSARPQVADLQFPISKNEAVTMSSLHGSVVHLVFWASWCEPCVAEMPRLFELYKKLSEFYQTKSTRVPYKLVLINLDDGEIGLQAARKMIADMPNGILSVFNGYPIAEKMLVEALPHHVIIDKSGHIAMTFEKSIEDNDDQLTAQLQKLLTD